MTGRAKGATLAEIMAAAGWQAHSVRRFISTASKKHGVKIESLKNESAARFGSNHRIPFGATNQPDLD